MLDDKVVIVTGGASGLGRETCLLFARHGASVVIADRNIHDAQQLEEDIYDIGGDAYAVQVDVSSWESVQTMVSIVLNVYGKIDVLINNAGITDDSSLLKMTEEQFDKVINVNLKGVFLCARLVAPVMVAQGYGNIINTSSIVGVYGNFGQTNYAAAKSGVIGMTKTWARELGRKNIRVNAVAPGFIKSPMTEKMPQKNLDDLVDKIAMKRLGIPEDVAKAYLFLASDLSSYANGEVLEVNGLLTL